MRLQKQSGTATLAMVTGALLIALGIVFYFGLGVSSFTALIPSAIGALILICGLIARDETKRRHAMHAAAGLGVLGLLGSLRGAPKWPALLSRQLSQADLPLAAAEQLAMFLICGAFVLLCVRSFMTARSGA